MTRDGNHVPVLLGRAPRLRVATVRAVSGHSWRTPAHGEHIDRARFVPAALVVLDVTACARNAPIAVPVVGQAPGDLMRSVRRVVPGVVLARSIPSIDRYLLADTRVLVGEGVLDQGGTFLRDSMTGSG